ncbi:MAG: tetratricopeptide repeat protein [Magnetococcales bacterium]|nr:tetratricopeptide repeat protein [Magnetococcales bacterium]
MVFPLRRALLWVMLATAVLYWPVAGFDFVNWDDDYYITRNPMVLAGWSLEGWHYAFTTSKPFLMPLPRLLFMTEVEFFGLHAGGFHLVNLLFHLLNIGLVGGVIFSYTRQAPLALVVASVFAFHPQRLEAVVWITELKEVMAAFFALLALLFYHRYVMVRRRLDLLVSFLGMLCSLLAKPLWVVLPFLLLVLDYWPLQRWKLGWATLLGEKWSFFLLSFFFSLLTLQGMEVSSGLVGLEELSLGNRLGHAFHAIALYLLAFFWPVDLSVYQPRPEMAWGVGSGLGVMAVVLMGFVVWREREQNPAWLTGWLWFLGLLVPVLGLVTGGMPVLMAHRWSYVSHVGLTLALANWWLRRFGWGGVSKAVGVLLLMAMLGLTRQQLFHWQDSTTLWGNAIQVLGAAKGADYPHGMLGIYYSRLGNPIQALPYFQEAARRNPEFPFYTLEAANAYLHSGDITQAWQWYERLVETTYAPGELILEVGRLGMMNGHYPQVAVYWQKAASKIQRESPEILPLLTAYQNLSCLALQCAISGLVIPESVPSQHLCKDILPLLTQMKIQGNPVEPIEQQVVVKCTSSFTSLR